MRSKGLRLIYAAFGAVLSAQALASSIDLSQAPTMNAMTTIPSQGIKIVESEGRIMAMSANGRWLFEGRIFDTWQMKQPYGQSSFTVSVSHEEEGSRQQSYTIMVNGVPLEVAYVSAGSDFSCAVGNTTTTPVNVWKQSVACSVATDRRLSNSGEKARIQSSFYRTP